VLSPYVLSPYVLSPYVLSPYGAERYADSLCAELPCGLSRLCAEPYVLRTHPFMKPCG
jgi:hypothetical protein